MVLEGGTCALCSQPPADTRHARGLAVPAGLEPATFGLGNRCSIRLSYGTFVDFIDFFRMVAAGKRPLLPFCYPMPFVTAPANAASMSAAASACIDGRTCEYVSSVNPTVLCPSRSLPIAPAAHRPAGA
jgi:hypothetical protein